MVLITTSVLISQHLTVLWLIPLVYWASGANNHIRIDQSAPNSVVVKITEAAFTFPGPFSCFPGTNFKLDRIEKKNKIKLRRLEETFMRLFSFV